MCAEEVQEVRSMSVHAVLERGDLAAQAIERHLSDRSVPGLLGWEVVPSLPEFMVLLLGD